MAALDEAFHLVSSTFKIPELNSHQKQAIRKIVSEKKGSLCKPADGLWEVFDLSSPSARV